jgi:hypothetical protein
VDDWIAAATSLLAEHPAVLSVEFAGSRSRGTRAELSDWDFAVETSDFDALARDMPALVAPMKPLAQQWEPMGHFPVYQVLLRGPTKIEYLFLTRSQEPLPALTPGPDTLAAINIHFWDWIWWLTTKAPLAVPIWSPSTCRSYTTGCCDSAGTSSPDEPSGRGLRQCAGISASSDPAAGAHRPPLLSSTRSPPSWTSKMKCGAGSPLQ